MDLDGLGLGIKEETLMWLLKFYGLKRSLMWVLKVDGLGLGIKEDVGSEI